MASGSRYYDVELGRDVILVGHQIVDDSIQMVFELPSGERYVVTMTVFLSQRFIGRL